MATLVRRKWTVVGEDGKAHVKRSRKWYGLYRDENGDKRRVALSANKTVAQQQLARILERVARKKAGVFHPAEEHGSRLLADHLADYLKEKAARGNPAEHVRQVGTRVRAVLDGCRFVYPADVKADAVLTFLKGLRQESAKPDLGIALWMRPCDIAKLLGITRRSFTKYIERNGLRDTAKGKGPCRAFPREVVEQILERRSKGLGSETVSTYWREMKAFCRWMASGRQQRILVNPLDGLTGPPPREEPRHDRRALTLAELRLLLASARASDWTWRGLTGEDRYHLYLTACATGYRRGELRTLTPASFDLIGDPPSVTVPGKKTKNKQLAVQPLAADVVTALAAYLAGRPDDAPLWPYLKAVVEALRHDLADAGIPYVVEGPEGPLYADFHALRHSYVRLLDEAGLSVKTAMSLARHSDPRLTLARYAKPQLSDLGTAVDRLPVLAEPERPVEGDRKTADGSK